MSHSTNPATPAMALGITDHVWSVPELIEAALRAVPTKPTPTPAQRSKSFRLIQGDLFERDKTKKASRESESPAFLNARRFRQHCEMTIATGRSGL
jgi:hypothetical protein